MSISTKLDLYQSKAIKAAAKALESDGKALVRMATGTGKTETAMKLFEHLDPVGDKRCLWLTHTNELVEQTAERFILRGLRTGQAHRSDVGIYNASYKEKNNKIVVASIPTLARVRALNVFIPDEFDIIIMDECHHAPADSWARVLQYFKGHKVGLTATPFRPDSQSLDEHFGPIVYDLDFKRAQKLGLLAPDQNKVILTKSTLNGLVSRNGEYTEKQLDRLYTSLDRNQTIVSAYRKYARTTVTEAGMKPKAICFCINIQHAIRMSEYFKRSGITSAYLCGDRKLISVQEREHTMDAFKNTNKIEIICVVNILSEGVDVPDCNIAIMCRPTQSNIVYQQSIGRPARINDGNKRFFFILDFVDQTNTEFQAYTRSSLDGKSIPKSAIVTEYLDESDPVVVDKITKDVMRKSDDFEVGMRKKFDATKVTEFNLKKFIKTREFQPWNP